ncbi:SHOCT domain-containing protein [Chloroflexota bacterium]
MTVFHPGGDIMWYMHEGMGWWMAFGSIWMVIFWGGLIALIVWGITRMSRQEGSTPKHDPLNVAKERYARGEITRKDFNQLKKDLS